VNGDFSGKARPKSIKVWLACEQNDLDRNALHDLSEVSGRVVGRKKSELRSACRGELNYFASECPIWQVVGVDICQGTYLNVCKLRLLEVRLHPG
jgi:hypothetical protein